MKMQLHKKEFSNKDGLNSESCSFWPKNVPKSIWDPPEEKILRIVFGNFVGIFEQKWKTIWDYATFIKGIKHLVGWISDSRPWSFFWKLPLGLIQTKCFKLSREKKCTSFIHHDKKMSNKSYLLRPSIICTAMSNKRKKMLLGPAMNFNAIRHLMQM